MRSYKTLILEAELLASPAERIHQWLEARAAKATRHFSDDLDLIIEKSLLARGDSLIDIALARFSGEATIAAELFNRANNGEEESTALKLAVLSNQMLGAGFNYRGLHGGLFEDDDAIAKWFAIAKPNEIAALFHNPTLNDSFLRDFLEGKESWKALSENGRLTAIFALAKNPRMSQEYDGYMDGWSEYSHSAVFSAAWELAQTVPTTSIWANALWELYNTLKRDSFMENPLEVAKRWKPDPSDKDASKSEKSSNDVGHLDAFQSVRSGLAQLALSKSSNLGKELLVSDDVALRVAAYSRMALTPDQLQAAYERDGVITVNYATHNEELWRSESTREVLREISWAVGKKDSDLLYANIFNGVRGRMEQKYPKWFTNRDETTEVPELTPKASSEPATKADVYMVLEAVGVRSEGTEPVLSMLKQLNAAILSLGKTLNWVWWFSAGALAMLFWRN